MPSQNPCSICGGELGVFRRLGDGRSLARCGACTLVHVVPRPERYAESAQLGDLDDFMGHLGRFQRAYEDEARVVLDRLERVVGQPGSLFEVGAAAGWFLDVALARGWDARGIEPASNPSSHGTDAARARIVRQTFEETSLPPHLDAVVMVQVLEHILDPSAALRRVAGALSARGAGFIEVPSYGAVSRRLRRPGWEHINLTGDYTSQQPNDGASRANTGNGLADLLLGWANQITYGNGRGEEIIAPYYGAYVQDDFKVSSRLTVNADEVDTLKG